MLLENGADIEVRNDLKLRPLHLAAHNGHLEAVKVLIAHGAELDAVHHRGFSALYFAACCSLTPVVEVLLAASGTVDTTKDSNRTAAQVEEGGYVEFLYTETALYSAVRGTYEWLLCETEEDTLGTHQGSAMDVTRLLLQHGADINRRGTRGLTALHEAIKSANFHGEEPMVDLLLSNGADMSAADDDGLIPLHYAIRYG